MSVYYTTIKDIQQQLIKEAPSDTTTTEYTNFVNYLQQQLIPEVSEYIERVTHRFFVPIYSTRSFYNRALLSANSEEQYNYWLQYRNPYTEFRLFLDWDLLEVDSYTSYETSISSSEYRLLGSPAYALDLDRDSGNFDFDTGGFSYAQIIAGFWGYHTDWDNAFSTVESITTTDSATDITVGDSTLYKYPQYIRCEDELMLITALPDATSLTVVRGVRGTTAAAHSSKSLQTFAIEPVLHLAATKIAVWLYQSRTSQGNVVQISDNTVVLDQLPTIIYDTLERLKKVKSV